MYNFTALTVVRLAERRIVERGADLAIGGTIPRCVGFSGLGKALGDLVQVYRAQRRTTVSDKRTLVHFSTA